MRRLAVLTNGLSEPEARGIARQALSQLYEGKKVRYSPQKDTHLTLHLPADQKLKPIVARA